MAKQTRYLENKTFFSSNEKIINYTSRARLWQKILLTFELLTNVSLKQLNFSSCSVFVGMYIEGLYMKLTIGRFVFPRFSNVTEVFAERVCFSYISILTVIFAQGLTIGVCCICTNIYFYWCTHDLGHVYFRCSFKSF